MERAKLLQQTPLFGGIREETVAFLLSAADTIKRDTDEYFFRENDDAQSLFVLEKGRVAVIKQWQATQHLLRNLGPGDLFGEMALLDYYPRSASVLATQPCVAIQLSHANLYDLYQKDLEQFTIIYMNLARELSRRLRATDQRLFTNKVEATINDGGLLYTAL